MPMAWTPQADAQLLAAIVTVYNVKGAQLHNVAELMGPNCTVKALMHRLAKLRGLAHNGDGEDGKPTNGSSPAGKGKAGGKKAGARTISNDVDDEEEIQTPPSAKRVKTKRAKTEGKAEEDDGLGNGVKIEVGEDIGQGLRAASEFEQRMGEMGEEDDVFQ